MGVRTTLERVVGVRLPITVVNDVSPQLPPGIGVAV